MSQFVPAQPYPWPYDGDLRPERTALVIIDMQADFCGKGGYIDGLGYDLTNARAIIPTIAGVLSRFRQGAYHVIHTREGHRPDLSDLPANKRWRSRVLQNGSGQAGIGDPGPCGRVLVRGEPGWEIIPELAPLPGEPVIDKPGKGSFYATDFDMVLRGAGIRNIVLCGLTTDVCVHTTMREANDRGYECLLLGDCCAATDADNHAAALKMVTMQNGVFGAVSTSSALLEALP
jgi:biuret amidohydrolase